MTTIKPSEGNNYFGQNVFVEGKITSPKTHTTAYGGRWVIRIADLDSPSGDYQAVLVLNEDPDKNPKVSALGVRAPNEAIKTIFSDTSFERLFHEEMTFRAEAIVGIYDGLAWFNISQIILFEPQFKIGTRQVYNEPICERRLLLRARGIRANRNINESPLGGPFIGNLVHSGFQQIITSTSKESLIKDFKLDPKRFLLRIVQPEAILLGAMGLLGDSPRLDGNEWVTVKNQIDRLIESEQVQSLLNKESEWFSEVPVSGTSIHGDIDLRSASRIIELKTGLLRTSHSAQLCVYLVGELIEHGFSIKDNREAYLISSSGQIQDDNLRVQKILGNSPQTLETLNRFLLTRHRLLMVSAGKKLPKINYSPTICKQEECEYYIGEQGDDVKSRCHFYCQTDRNWPCQGCPHVTSCTEYLKYHSFDVLDEANRIRDSLSQEIEFTRKWLADEQSWSGDFEIVSIGLNRIMVLKPLSCYSFDPPSPGDKIIIMSESQKCATNGQMVKICDDDNWVIINRGRVSEVIGSRVTLVQPRSELNGIYYLQSCLDELQCLGEISNREGISFAGGSIVSGQPEIRDDLQLTLSDHLNTDIFCQSFDIRISKQILQDVINTVKGRVLIVTDVKNLPLDQCIDIRGEQLLTLTSTATSITNAFMQVKDHLEKHNQWITSPNILLNTDIFFALPNRGRNYFDYIIIYETNSVTGLEYFLMRQFGRYMITIGDANCIGRNLHSNDSKLLGLGDNLMTRVFGRGFPRVEGKMIPQIVFLKKQPLDPTLNNGLISCRMISSDSVESKRSIEFISSNSSSSQDNPEQLIYSLEFDHPEGGPFRELQLKIDDLIPSIELENDLIDLVPQINTSLFENDTLTSPSSGRRYVVMQVPSIRDDDGTRWIVRFYTTANPLRTNISEMDEVIRSFKRLILNGVKPKNIAIMSSSKEQLEMIIKKYEKDLLGVSFRTPYGIRGENWGNIIVSCVSNSPQDIDVRELYTMIRASITRAIIIGQPNILKYHPLLRNMGITVSNDKSRQH